jgi:nucleoside-diphosphate-sugar epimerase
LGFPKQTASRLASRSGQAGVIFALPRPTPTDFDDFTKVNVAGTKAWLDLASRQGIGSFVFVSTIKAVAAGSEPMQEAAPPETTAPYG